ncbi:arylamine N-acetyltransferase [Mycobacterium sp. ACS4331]|uniref:arylamine N-acetyltransferase family protein n=1 Tax=Mycobacterium sp. ACS4331 TaxID=1834121 RepID=UPI0007FEC2A7|nr:arylamine N-acetyltransferase [Mycobacterium sp. ACS4331]OBF29176.1 arylamine N-acetyltransferase [Mycobacterium sp. ACS4331]
MVTEALRVESTVDVGDYLARIGWAGPVAPTLDVLRALVSAHLRHIPFENLDPLMGIPVGDLSVEALFAKMVHRRRGGYCFEHNGLFRHVLESVGFAADALTARVVWRNPDGVDATPGPLTHQLLAVRVPGVTQRYVVDVGFGGQTLTGPIEFRPGAVQQTPNEPYRIGTHAGDFVLETQIGHTWRPLYLFADEPRPLIDLEVGSWYVSTHPESTFVSGLSASMIVDGARWNLRGRNLAVHSVGAPTEHIRLANASEVLGVLMNTFGLDVGGIGDVHARITEVLDA